MSEAITIAGVITAILCAAAAWLSGGTAGTEYDVTCQIVTSSSRTDERTMTIRVEER